MLFITTTYNILTTLFPNYENHKQIGLISILLGLVLYILLYFSIFKFKDEYYLMQLIPGLLYIFQVSIIFDILFHFGKCGFEEKKRKKSLASQKEESEISSK